MKIESFEGEMKGWDERISQKGKKYNVVFVGDREFMCWERGLLEGLRIGQRVLVQFKRAGTEDKEFLNMSNITVSEAAKPQTTLAKPLPSLGNGVVMPLSMARCNALNNATEIVTKMTMIDNKADVKIDILELAEAFEKWLVRE